MRGGRADAVHRAVAKERTKSLFEIHLGEASAPNRPRRNNSNYEKTHHSHSAAGAYGSGPDLVHHRRGKTNSSHYHDYDKLRGEASPAPRFAYHQRDDSTFVWRILAGSSLNYEKGDTRLRVPFFTLPEPRRSPPRLLRSPGSPPARSPAISLCRADPSISLPSCFDRPRGFPSPGSEPFDPWS